MRYPELEDRLNMYEAKMSVAEEEDNISKWKRYHSRQMGYMRALKDLGFEVDWDAEHEQYVVEKGE